MEEPKIPLIELKSRKGVHPIWQMKVVGVNLSETQIAELYATIEEKIKNLTK